jgi:hypothetical protein
VATAGGEAPEQAILQALPAPNPVPPDGLVMVRLSRPVSSLELRLYSAGMTLLGKSQGGPFAPGWAPLPLGPALGGAVGGTYYIVVTGTGPGGHPLNFVKQKIFVLR